MQLEQQQSQKQTLSPQQIQSTKILQMGIQELREYIDQESLENPLLEFPDQPGEDLSDAPLREQVEWRESDDPQNALYHRQDSEGSDPLAHVGRWEDDEQDLGRYILSQFLGTELEPQVLEGIRFLIEQLDDRGWLEEDTDALFARSGLPRQVMERALLELQAADPAGVGARDLAECLCLQIQRWAGDHRLSEVIVRGHLDALAKGRYRYLAQELGADEDSVRAACAFVQTLDPHPAMGFSARQSLPYIIPDVTVTSLPGHLELTLNPTAIPRLRLNQDYLQMLQTTQDEQVRSYLTDRSARAKELIRNIEQRGHTLLRCLQFMAGHQEAFFRSGPGHLAPLTMEQTAEALSLSTSTVSRAVRDKYFQCQWGVYPLSFLFSRSFGGSDASSEQAKVLLRRLVDGETRPLSDQKLSEALGQQGIAISRRTVAKYREELGIPSAAQRKGRQPR